MKAVLFLVAVLVFSVVACGVSLADGASSGKGGPSPSKKQTGAQSGRNNQSQRQPRPSDNGSPPLQVQLPSFDLTLSQGILDRVKKSKK